ncbi:hypothetical protein GCM10025867_44880 [Frondihabitans sucicola]|uniref:Carboxylesterase type B domain-containing protein n=1 Tax=Frondihabitans sucicola TaxID=1268041 RepID=A0ABN6XS83_9MICO|nr:hypothetical protein GCM10025867_00140 [Frondihabitans sucicola]BDZ52247.1 hypothetical protein GCM10025867_44880 [Frondihabitans sucicola]
MVTRGQQDRRGARGRPPLLFGTEAAWTKTALVGPSDWPAVEQRGRALRKAWADFARTGRVGATSLPASEVEFFRD